MDQLHPCGGGCVDKMHTGMVWYGGGGGGCMDKLHTLQKSKTASQLTDCSVATVLILE